MTLNIGITVGKFMPLHKGHELMIDFGAAMLDELYIFVSGKETDEIPLDVRFKWVQEYVERAGLRHKKHRCKHVHVLKHIDNSPTPVDIDEDGTVLDPDFQMYWAEEFASTVGGITHFLSSDMYGNTMAKVMGVKWLPCDPGRETISISGTTIRENIFEHFNLISDVAKPYFVKKVAIVGPESTGKSTAVKVLSKYFGAIGVHEYGRTISEVLSNDLTAEDFDDIVRGQDALIDSAVKKSTVPVMFTDTEALTTYLFGKLYLNEKLHHIKEHAATQDFDLYIVLAPNVEWVDDGSRMLSELHQRVDFFNELMHLLREYKKPLVIVDSTNHRRRTQQAILTVSDLLEGK